MKLIIGDSMPPILGRIEITCAECGTLLVRVVQAPFDIIVCPMDLRFGDYNKDEWRDSVSLRQGPIANPEMIGYINRFWLTGRQPP